MSDFRINKIREALKKAGISETFYNESEKVVCFDNYMYFSFADSQKIVYNAICMEVPDNKKTMLTVFCRMVNETYKNVDFAVTEGLLMAYTAISNSIFMRDDNESELLFVLGDIIDETKSGTKHMYQLMNK